MVDDDMAGVDDICLAAVVVCGEGNIDVDGASDGNTFLSGMTVSVQEDIEWISWIKAVKDDVGDRSCGESEVRKSS